MLRLNKQFKFVAVCGVLHNLYLLYKLFENNYLLIYVKNIMVSALISTNYSNKVLTNI